jgi:hypothetical protein
MGGTAKGSLGAEGSTHPIANKDIEASVLQPHEIEFSNKPNKQKSDSPEPPESKLKQQQKD